jgi:hypothetical protein
VLMSFFFLIMIRTIEIEEEKKESVRANVQDLGGEGDIKEFHHLSLCQVDQLGFVEDLHERADLPHFF